VKLLFSTAIKGTILFRPFDLRKEARTIEIKYGWYNILFFNKENSPRARTTD
jgi:hypothetical protein